MRGRIEAAVLCGQRVQDGEDLVGSEEVVLRLGHLPARDLVDGVGADDHALLERGLVHAAEEAA
jgi:hypothetical protein